MLRFAIALLVSAPGIRVLAEDVRPRSVEIEPVAARDAIRPPVRGTWQPGALPPNDLGEPENYPAVRGGACVGMCSVVHGLWASDTRDFELTVKQTSDVFIRNMVAVTTADGRAVMPNHALPGRVVMENGDRLELRDRRVLVRIAEIVQNRLSPGGGANKTPEEIRESFREISRYAGRVTRTSRLRSVVSRAGGRLVVGAIHIDDRFTEHEGHAIVLTLDARGDLHVWDPNARMKPGALGSDRLAPLRYDLVDADRYTAIRYDIELPDGTKQARKFEFVFPIAAFVRPDRIPPLPRPR